jgi:hypothetical protein
MSLLEEWGVIETQEHLITFWQKHDWQMNKKKKEMNFNRVLHQVKMMKIF